MANEFIARKGIKVLANGAIITGSSEVQGSVTASGDIIATNFTGSFFTGSFVGDGAGLTGIATTLAISGSTGSDTVDLKNDVLAFSGSNGVTTAVTDNTVTIGIPAGTVSASSQVDHNSTTNYVANEHIDHSTVEITAGAGLNGGGNITATRTLSVNSGSMLPYYSSSIFSTVSGDITITAGGVATIGANSVELGTDTTGNYASAVTAGDGISVTGTAGEGTSFEVSVNTGSTHFTSGVVGSLPAGTVSASSQVSYTGLSNIPAGIVSSSNQVTELLPAGTVSASSQVIASSVTGIANYAQLTGSNTFTAINTFSNTTNSTNWNNGAVVLDGGLGVAKDVWISGSINILGLLTATSTSIQYITSSQLDIGTNIITLNSDTPAVRYAGISVFDSGSVGVSASFLFDSLTNNWVFKHKDVDEETEDFSYAIFGPLGTSPDNIPILTGNYIVKVEDDGHGHHIMTSSIFDNGTFVSVGLPLQVTGSISSSVGFSGDGSNVTGVTASSVAFSNITGKPSLVSASSQVDHNSTTNYVANEHIDHSTIDITAGLGMSGGGNITATRTLTLDTGSAHFVTGSRKTISASNTTGASGINLTYNNASGIVSGSLVNSAITINNTSVDLGGTRNITLSEITAQGATTTNQVSLNGGAIIHGTLFTSSSESGIVAPITNDVVATFPTGSYDASHFDYIIKDGTNYRTGTVMAVWNTTGTVQFTDTSTNDIGNTLGAEFIVDTFSGNVRLKFSATTGTWTVKTSVRIF